MCNNCNLDLTATYGGATTDEGNAHCSACKPGGTGYHTQHVIVGYTHIDPEPDTYIWDSTPWDETVTVNDYQYCSKCGERK